MLRLHQPLLTNLDEWIEAQKDRPSRPEAIRRILEHKLARSSRPKTPSKQKAQKALDMADRTVEGIADKSIPPEEQRRRKRALIKGPKEFRDIRGDLPESET